MPWREDATPYHVYLSEIMLQQTQVDTVRAYYERFIQRFPTLPELAKAEEEEVLKLWEGLGYYSRGRNLHQAAIEILQRYHGELPRSKEDLLALPGIGEYTSKAIRAIAFHEKEIAVDGNLMRVYARLVEQKEPNLEKMKGFCNDFFLTKLVKEDPSEFNQALMDLGEMVCLPKAEPRCDECPFVSFCQAHLHQTTTLYPPGKKSKAKRVEEWTLFLFSCQGKIALIKRPNEGLLASLYAFPSLPGKLGKEDLVAAFKNWGIEADNVLPLPEKEHVFSHLIWQMKAYRIPLEEMPKVPEWIWVTPAKLTTDYPMPSAYAYYKKEILKELA